MPAIAGGMLEAGFLEKARDDGAGGTDDIVSEEDGCRGLNVRDAVMIHDAQQLRFVQAVNRLGPLVVIDQVDAVPP